MQLKLKHLPLFLCSLTAFAQVQFEVSEPEYIKSITFKGPTEDQFPIIQLGDPVRLEFDDLSASEQDYYYRIVHCDYNWEPSQLLKSQYLKGVDNQRIITYENSYTTLQPYSNYRLILPNPQVGFRVSGNYMLEIYNSNDQLQFSRRFVIFKDMVQVAATIKRSRDFEFIGKKQSVQFSIRPSGINLINPKKEVKVVLLQNYHWPTARYNLPPQYTIGNELIYRYDQQSAFYGGNEYLNFDSSDLRAPTAMISSIEMKDLYHHYLFTNRYRVDEEYTYFPDINGDYVIRTLQGVDPSRESEYTWVHFSLPYTDLIGFDEVYIFGKFNNYALQDLNRMQFDEASGKMKGKLLLKQGFYNFKYVIRRADDTVELNSVSGTFDYAENTYTILVYYRDFGDIYDSVIGIGTANSSTISN